MVCPRCQASSAANATSCLVCGQSFTAAPASPSAQASQSQVAATSPAPVPNPLVWSILATLCCCLPGGVVSIYYAMQTSSRLAAGDTEGARQAAKSAQMWAWVSMAIGLIVAMGSSTAVVGGPQFAKYMRNAKTAEANENLDRIRKGAADYYAIHGEYPATVFTTPLGVSCCDAMADADDDDRCDANLEPWQTPTWQALNFSIADSHYFQYTFTSAGSGRSAKYTATANGDLDCDGTYSTFQIYGSPSTGDHPMIFRDNETE